MAEIIPNDVQFRAASGEFYGFGATPGDALNSLLSRFNLEAPSSPIVIWAYDRRALNTEPFPSNCK